MIAMGPMTAMTAMIPMTTKASMNKGIAVLPAMSNVSTRVAASFLFVLVLLAGCASAPPTRPAGGATTTGESEAGATPAPRGGGYYLDDGPGMRTPQQVAALAALPDPVPMVEPLHRWANRPYRVMGSDYQPMTARVPFVQRGVASWYGRKFHGQPTSTGEPYDMYAMTAAHPTLPLPSYARVTNLENGRSVVVRVNDRGPFLHGRVVDLSYLAAYKLGYVQNGSARVQVELLEPSSTLARGAEAKPAPATVPAAATATAPSPSGASSSSPSSTASASATSTAAAPSAMPAGPAAAPVAGAPVAPEATSPAAATASPIPTPSAATTASASHGEDAHYLQLGAFGSAANAAAASANLRRKLDWLQAPIEVQPAGALYRVQAGPYPMREQAARAGAEIESRTGLRPLLLPR